MAATHVPDRRPAEPPSRPVDRPPRLHAGRLDGARDAAPGGPGPTSSAVASRKELADRVRREVGDDPPAGRLVSIGWQDLYLLGQFLA